MEREEHIAHVAPWDHTLNEKKKKTTENTEPVQSKSCLTYVSLEWFNAR